MSFKKSNCSPTNKKNDFTCYTTKSLIKLRDLWNTKHPDVKIDTNSPKEIWESLKKHMGSLCSNEKCWLRQEFSKHNITKDLESYTFAPTAPESWKKNPNEWLSSLDIERVMKQHEKNMSNFNEI